MYGKVVNISSPNFCESHLGKGNCLYDVSVLIRGVESNVKCDYFCQIRPLTIEERAKRYFLMLDY